MHKLQQLAIKFGVHPKKLKLGYFDLYELYFSKFFIGRKSGIFDKKKKDFNILELGIQFGRSVELLIYYFRNFLNTAYGLDVKETIYNNTYFKHKKLKMFIGRQEDKETLKKIINEAKSFDVIIDDCSHHTYNTNFSLTELFPYLKSGGLYVIEDIGYCKMKEFKVDMLKYEETGETNNPILKKYCSECKNHLGQITFLTRNNIPFIP
jgi:hypothetical protein